MRRLHTWWLAGMCIALSASQGRSDDASPTALELDGARVITVQSTAQPKPGTQPTKPGTEKAAPPRTTPLPVPDDQLAAAAPTTGRLTISQIESATPISMLGDVLTIPALAFGRPGNGQFPPPPGAARGAILVPSIRGLKVADNESPFPRDRLFFGFNYWDDVNGSVNQRGGGDLRNIRVFRETFGVEKTFLNGDMSAELRLPLNTLTTDSVIPGMGGSSTDIGDLSVILKVALLQDLQAGNILSAGLAVTAPTGPDAFAGFADIRTLHETTLQPFVGYRFAWGDFFIHGFTSIDVPTDSKDVTLLFNDIGVGYYAYRNQDEGALIRAVVPTFEVHVNTPLNHRGAFNLTDVAATPDVVDLTMGGMVALGQRSVLSVAFVTPVTGPKPFDFEIIAQFNWRFGPGGRGSSACSGSNSCDSAGR